MLKAGLKGSVGRHGNTTLACRSECSIVEERCGFDDKSIRIEENSKQNSAVSKCSR